MSGIVRNREPLRESWGGDRRLRQAFASVSFPPDHPIAPYLEFEHNEARVLDCARERCAFSLTINHYNVWRLAATVDKRNDAWHRLRDRFPVTLRFEEVKELRIVQQREEGDYRILRASLDGLAAALFDVISLHCVGKDEGSLCFSLEMNNGGRLVPVTSGFWAGEITVLLECGSVSVSENLRQNWDDCVGVESLPLLDALLQAGPVQDWAVSDFERFVEAEAGQGAADP